MGGRKFGPQSEGTFPGDGAAPSEWDYWFTQVPEQFFDGVGPSVTSDYYHKFREYHGLMKEVGMNSSEPRFSGAGLFPTGKAL